MVGKFFYPQIYPSYPHESISYPQSFFSFYRMQYLFGSLLGILIGVLAWHAGALSVSGAWAAAICGGLIFGFGGLPWAALLLTFFLSSSFLSRVSVQRKSGFIEKFAKGSQRDWAQVAANGGLGAALVIIQSIFPDQQWSWVAYAGAMAAVNADTWATELGVLSSSPPRLITNGKVVERGTSGGVSLLGSLSALGGALLIALFATAFTGRTIAPPFPIFALLVGATLGGFAGSFFDSLLGATVQGIYYCPSCQKETERHPTHLCGEKTTPLRGWSWLNNDLVNFFASIFGALTAIAIGVLFL